VTTEKTLIFVPTYNERDNAGRLHEQIRALGFDADILFLDDNSPDGTGELLDQIATQDPRFSVIHRPGKQGVGSAHLSGIHWAYEHGYERLVTLDCDFTHNPADIPRLLKHARNNKCDIVVGSRYMLEDCLPGWNLLRRFLTHTGHFLTRRLLGVPQDASGAFRIYDLKRIPKWFWGGIAASGYSFFFESMFLLVQNNYVIHELPIVLPARTYGNSKMSLREAARSGFRIVSLFLQKLIEPSRFSIPPPFLDIDPALNDPQQWDAYWAADRGGGSVIYDAIAITYRNLVIRRRLNLLIKRHFARGAELLHTGCGSGQVDVDIGTEMSITALDISVPALNAYRKANPYPKLLKHGSIFALPFAEASFDGVYNLGLMEHFTSHEITQILQQTQRVLKPGGKAVIFWPHHYGTSVNVLRFVHWISNSVLKRRVQLHPPEITHCRGGKWARQVIIDSGLTLEDYSFGPGDFWVQAILVLKKPHSNYSLARFQSSRRNKQQVGILPEHHR
jgi:dolichol-phosphate mannosyltransferase